MENIEYLDGEIYEIIYQNEENGYTVCDVSVNKNLVTVCGYMPYIAPGENVHISGKWITHPDYGEQFSAKTVERTLPKKTSAVLAYLSSGAISGIRESTAKKIIKLFGEDTLDVIANEPEKLAQIKGITLTRAQKMSESFLLRRDSAQIIMFLQEYGVSASLALRVHKALGQTAVDLIKANPYILCEKVDRIGFKTADRIATAMNISSDHPGRISAGIKHALIMASLSGHTCLEYDQMLLYAEQILSCSKEKIADAFLPMSAKGELIFENNIVYLPVFYNAELNIASRISLMQQCTDKLSGSIAKDIRIQSENCGIALSDMQKEAIRAINENSVTVITGGPGTGKTTIMKVVLEILRSKKLEVALCAPTGKAAKRLAEACGRESRTLHRLLEVNGSSEDLQKFARNEQNQLAADVVIIDEMSMVDLLLFSALLKAMKKGSRLILAGDCNQLPSVGAGNVLWDLIESGRVSSVKLNEVFRQAQESRIVTNAHMINSGQMPVANTKGTDFFFMNTDTEQAVATITQLCSGRLNKAYGYNFQNDIQVLSPSRKGLAGTVNLNKVLQEKLNPPFKDKKEKKIGDKLFRVGDKVIQTKNNYDVVWTASDKSGEGLGVFNGDIGIITDISFSDKIITVCFDDMKIVEYDYTMAEDLDTAYALTVHKSQGSEWNAVIIPVCQFPPMLMTRNLLYTAVTRARKTVILVGNQNSVYQMITNNHIQKRYSTLAKRLRDML